MCGYFCKTFCQHKHQKFPNLDTLGVSYVRLKSKMSNPEALFAVPTYIG